MRFSAKTPWSTAAIVLTLALGTGLNSAVVAVGYGILYRPLPYHDPSRIVELDRAVPLGELTEWNARLRTIESLAGHASADHALRGLGEPRIVRAAFVTDRFFEVLQPSLVVGRALGRDTGAAGLMVSERLMDAAHQDSTKAIGSTINIVDRAFAVLGVLPRGVRVPSERVDVWLPAQTAAAIPLIRSDDRTYRMIARLKPGVTLEQATDDATRVRRELAAGTKEDAATLRVAALPLDHELQRTARPAVWAFGAAALLVLAIACANVASMLLGRAVVRARETAIHLALGAGPSRVLRGLLVEGLVLAFTGSALGLFLAFAGVRFLRSNAAGVLPRLDAVRLDVPVLAIAAGFAAVVAVACAMGPGLQAIKRGISPIVRESGASGLGPRRRLNAALAGVQLALSIVVLIGAALLGQSMLRLLAVDAGVDPRNTVVMRLMLSERSIMKPGERVAFVGQLLEELRRLPGVTDVGFGTSLPPDTSQVEMSIRLKDGSRDETMMMHLVSATPGYRRALGARLLEGRFLQPEDASASPPVVVVSPAVARHLFKDRYPIGREVPVALPGNRGAQKAVVIGVLDDVRYSGLAKTAGGAIYIPWEQLPLGVVHLVVRASQHAPALAPAVRTIVQKLDPAQPIGEIRSFEDVVTSSVADRRLHAFLASSFAVLALGVALLGLVATLGRMVTDRRHELAVRSALGATPRQAIGLVMAHAAKLTVAGVVAGSVIALLASKGIASYLFGVTQHDVVTYAMVGSLTTVAALLACFVPAYRASLVDPATLLRD